MPIDRTKIEESIEEAQRRGGEFKEWPGRLQPLPRISTTDLRIFEYTSEDGSRIFAHPITIHRCTDKGELVGICTQKISKGLCYYCMINNLARKLGSPEPFKSQLRYVINAIDLNYIPEIVKLFVIPMTVFKQIAWYVLTDRWAHVLEAKRGQIFSIKRHGEGLDTKYSVKLLPKKYPVGNNIIEQVVDPIVEIDYPDSEFKCDTFGCNQICNWPLNPV